MVDERSLRSKEIRGSVPGGERMAKNGPGVETIGEAG